MNLGNPTKTIFLEKNYTVLKKLKSKSDKCFEQKKKEEKTEKEVRQFFADSFLQRPGPWIGSSLTVDSFLQKLCHFVASDKWHIFFKSILKSGMRRLGANCVPSNRSFLDGQKHIDQGIFSFSFSTSYSWVYLIVYLEFPILQWVLMLMAATVGKIIQVFVVLFIFVLFSCMCRVWCKVWCLCFITRVWSHCQCSYDGCSYKMTTSYF